MRHLLALFALLTGLTALCEPVRATESGVAAVRVEQGTATYVQVAPAIIRLAGQPCARMLRQVETPLLAAAFTAPAFILKADRAHE